MVVTPEDVAEAGDAEWRKRVVSLDQVALVREALQLQDRARALTTECTELADERNRAMDTAHDLHRVDYAVNRERILELELDRWTAARRLAALRAQEDGSRTKYAFILREMADRKIAEQDGFELAT